MKEVVLERKSKRRGYSLKGEERGRWNLGFGESFALVL